jgi:hypothetical protein
MCSRTIASEARNVAIGVGADVFEAWTTAFAGRMVAIATRKVAIEVRAPSIGFEAGASGLEMLTIGGRPGAIEVDVGAIG